MTTTAPPARYYVTFAVLLVAVAAYSLLQSLVIPVLPTIQAGLHTSQNTVTWVLTAYLLAASIFTPILGRLGDMYGKERVLLLTLIALTVGSLLAAIAGSIGLMIVARVIQGIGGGVLPLAFGIVRDQFPRDKVAGAVGMIAALSAAGAGLGIVLAGPIVAALDYHWLFWIPMAVVALATVATYFVIPASDVKVLGRLNWVAAMLLAAWLVCLLLAISEAPRWGWGSAAVIGLLLAAVAIATIWVIFESRSLHPLIDMQMMRIPVVWTTNLVAMLMGIGLYAGFAFIPEFVQADPSAGYGFAASVTRSGLIMLPLSIGMFIFGISSGRLSLRYGAKRVLVAGAAISIGCFTMLTVAHSTESDIVIAMAILGASFGLAFAAMASLIVEGVPATQTGVASGMNANIRTIGGSIGAAVMSSVVTASAGRNGIPRESGYVHGFGLMVLAAVAATIAASCVPAARRMLTRDAQKASLPHAELGLVAAGTLLGDDPE
jgi:EmrB/QacA subfamily drug resistance transporter